MLEINANPNATVDVLSGDFALGQRNTILIHILDKIISDRISIVGTGTCTKSNNLYSYGELDNLDNVKYSLAQEAVLDIGISNIDDSFSNCLHCKAETDEGLGLVYLPVNKLTTQLEVGTNMILSFYINVTSGNATFVAKGKDSHEVFPNFTVEYDADKQWQHVIKEFTITEDTNIFNLYLDTAGIGEFYLDNVMLFKASDEIKNAQYGIDAEILVKNPIQDTCIEKVINWNKLDDGNIDITLYFPPITVVDYQDSILCQLRIYQHTNKRVVTLGNTTYNSTKNIIYNSEPFALNGFMLPKQDYDDLDVDLIVDKI